MCRHKWKEPLQALCRSSDVVISPLPKVSPKYRVGFNHRLQPAKCADEDAVSSSGRGATKAAQLGVGLWASPPNLHETVAAVPTCSSTRPACSRTIAGALKAPSFSARDKHRTSWVRTRPVRCQTWAFSLTQETHAGPCIQAHVGIYVTTSLTNNVVRGSIHFL